MQIHTGKIGRRAIGLPIDITVKSATGGARLVAPTWSMVMAIKRGVITTNEYTAAYESILESNRDEILRWVAGLPDVVTFQCYCRPKAFCHRVIFADWLVRNINASYAGES